MLAFSGMFGMHCCHFLEKKASVLFYNICVKEKRCGNSSATLRVNILKSERAVIAFLDVIAIEAGENVLLGEETEHKETAHIKRLCMLQIGKRGKQMNTCRLRCCTREQRGWLYSGFN